MLSSQSPPSALVDANRAGASSGSVMTGGRSTEFPSPLRTTSIHRAFGQQVDASISLTGFRPLTAPLPHLSDAGAVLLGKVDLRGTGRWRCRQGKRTAG